MRIVSLGSTLALGVLALSGVSCGPGAAGDPALATPLPEQAARATAITQLGDSALDQPYLSVGLTYQQKDGNRFVAGKGTLPDLEPLDIELSGRPQWLVAAPMKEGSVWVAILEDGSAEAFFVQGDFVESVAVEPGELPPGMPPVLVVEDDLPRLLMAGRPDASALSHAVQWATGSSAHLTSSGDLVIDQDGAATQLAVRALPDARLLIDESDRLLFLSDPTTHYGHGVLGDEVEAGSFTVVDTLPSPDVALRVEIGPNNVVEGIAPIWTDLDADGAREIIVTESDASEGARIVAYDQSGIRVATGPAIGTGYRWRHQLAVAPFGPNGELELATVLTPHIGGTVEFYRKTGDELQIVARLPGYSSHIIGSRNLDRALAGDFDGDNLVELLLPDQGQNHLGAIQRTSDGAMVTWEIPLEGILNTNLAAVTFPDGTQGVGAGRVDEILRLWLPMSD